MTNYLHTPNPFNLAGPPGGFLAELYAYDAELVIFPSQEEGVYRVARRVRHGAPTAHALVNRPDTKTYVQYRLVPVTSLLAAPFTNWGPHIIWELAERDMQRVGGADAAANLLEAHEDRVDARIRAEAADGADMRAIDMYREFKAATGQRVSLSSANPEGARTSGGGPRRRVSRPSHWRGASDAVFAR